MNKYIQLAAVTATVIGMELAGMSGATQALADPEDEDIIADQLCPFRNVIDRLGGALYERFGRLDGTRRDRRFGRKMTIHRGLRS